MFAFFAPGQGSQTPGMPAAWLRDPEHAARVRDWSQAADVDLAHLGTRASAAGIARTENTQPLLVAHARPSPPPRRPGRGPGTRWRPVAPSASRRLPPSPEPWTRPTRSGRQRYGAAPWPRPAPKPPPG